MAPKPWKATLLPWKVGFGVVFFFYNKDTESILLACSFVFLTNFSQNKFYPVAHVTIHSETEQQENYKPWMVVGAVMMEKDFLGNSSWEVQSILGPYLQRAWYIKQEKCTQLTLTKCSNRRTNTQMSREHRVEQIIQGVGECPERRQVKNQQWRGTRSQPTTYRKCHPDWTLGDTGGGLELAERNLPIYDQK